MGKLNISSMSDGQTFEKEEKGDDNMEQKQMEEELKGKMNEKQTCEMEKEIDSTKGPKHEWEQEPNTTKGGKSNFPIPSSKCRTRQNTSYHHGADVDPNNPLPL